MNNPNVGPRAGNTGDTRQLNASRLLKAYRTHAGRNMREERRTHTPACARNTPTHTHVRTLQNFVLRHGEEVSPHECKEGAQLKRDGRSRRVLDEELRRSACESTRGRREKGVSDRRIHGHKQYY